MTEARYRELKSLEKMVKEIPGFDPEARAAPTCCEDCEYYQPHWKYRCCHHIYCPYHIKEKTFREHPLANDLLPGKEVVRMDGI